VQGLPVGSLKVLIRGTRHPGLLVSGGPVLVLIGLATLLTCPPGWAENAAQSIPPRAPSNVTVESNPQLFATMCALQVAGFEKDVSPAGMHPLGARLRGQLLRLEGPAIEALRAYYREHELADPAATLSRYVSFALVAGPPPKFRYILRHDELPPDVLAIEGFNDVLANFYNEGQIGRLWSQVEPEYGPEIARLHAPLAQLVMSSTGYLRELVRSGSPRTFAVYVEPLVGGKTNFRNVGDHYAIVLNPGAELPLDDVRHALLHFLLDPLALRYSHVVTVKQPLLEFAAHAPRLPVEFKNDFRAFVTECLVRAVELRLRRLSPDKLAAAIDEAEGDGYVLVRPFSRELARFEKAEPAMSFYFPDLVRAIDVAEESKRLQNVVFAAARTGVSGAPGNGAQAAERTELDRWLAEGEQQIAAQNAAGAAASFERVLAKYPEQPRALYGLAVAAVLQGDADHAKQLFGRLVVNPPPSDPRPGTKDPLILAWSHVYLGRIYDVDGNRELAVSEYRAALAVEGAPESARRAARRGIEKGYEPGPRNPDTVQQRP